MRALITGIAGFAGGHLAQILLGRGDTLFGVDRYIRAGLKHLSPELTLVNADLCDPEAVTTLLSDIQPEAIYHLAGQALDIL